MGGDTAAECTFISTTVSLQDISGSGGGGGMGEINAAAAAAVRKCNAISSFALDLVFS